MTIEINQTENLPRINVGFYTAGAKREGWENQDSFFADPQTGVGVFDGVGSLPGGGRASAAAKDLIQSFFTTIGGLSFEQTREKVRESLEKAHTKEVEYRLNSINGDKGATTAVVGYPWIVGTEAKWISGHVGDSRTYLLRRADIERKTIDHAVDNILTRGIGYRGEPEIVTFDLERGDRILLCSDGISGNLDDEAIKKIISENPNDQEAAQKLVEEAQRAGKKDDDITAIVITPIFPERRIVVDRAAPAEDSAVDPRLAALATAPQTANETERRNALQKVRENIIRLIAKVRRQEQPSPSPVTLLSRVTPPDPAVERERRLREAHESARIIQRQRDARLAREGRERGEALTQRRSALSTIARGLAVSVGAAGTILGGLGVYFYSREENAFQEYGVSNKDGTYFPLYHSLTSNDIKRSVDMIFMQRDLVADDFRKLFGSENNSPDPIGFMLYGGISDEVLVKIAKEGKRVVFSTINGFGGLSDLPIAAVETAIPLMGAYATRRNFGKWIFSGLGIWGASRILSEIPVRPVQRMAGRLNALHPENPNLYFVDAKMAHSMTTAAYYFGKERGKKPNVLINIGGEHNNVEEFLKQGLTGPRRALTTYVDIIAGMPYSKSVLQSAVDRAGGLDNFCSTVAITLPADFDPRWKDHAPDKKAEYRRGFKIDKYPDNQLKKALQSLGIS